ncbi:hypothetical protein J3B02_000954 [Coemansia erecta]|uniref:CCHC-type domain-containing protein n=1 Tax=Coemansia asiatica TaxID=1052880 RepID=A0A9W7XLV2_9FUNG|nr:hypothetical protein LPJ64_003017 [Coemansia asiatica]KAJ2857516.1 hypothetical protein J3B02_000954 [Coemansia erecta]KAJ2888943.1 hypothetical protein FB639_000264 [Coemansia asiatica]
MEEDGPAFISFSGLPDENVHEFVESVDSLRKHFKWSSQITFCYARTMLKGAARKIIQTTGKGTMVSNGAATGQAKSNKTLADEALDPNSWGNLKSALIFEFSEQFTQDRLLVQLLSIKQQTGESGSEYAQRFISLVSELVSLHPLDSSLLAVLFTNGLRSEKLRWELFMRRLASVDRAIGYVAPDQLYRAAKLVPLLSPVSMRPPAVDAAEELSPTSETSTAFTVPANASAFIDESDALSTQEIYGNTAPSSLLRGSTANGASFSLDDDNENEDVVPMDSGYWTPPCLPDAQQRRLHRQNPGPSAYARPRQATAPAIELRSLERTQSMVSIGSASGESEDPKSSDLNALAEQLENLSFVLREKSDERRRRPRLCYRCRQKGHVASDCPLPPDVSLPKQQQQQQSRDNLGLPSSASSTTTVAAQTDRVQHSSEKQARGQQQHAKRKPLARSNTVSSASLPWRASSVAVYNSIVESNRISSQPNSPLANRRYTQSWGWNSGQQQQQQQQHHHHHHQGMAYEKN